MIETVIGIDPDIHKSGVSRYHRGHLVELLALSAPELVDYCCQYPTAHIALEHPSSTRLDDVKRKGSKAAQLKIQSNVTANNQVAVMLGEFLEYHFLSVYRYERTAGNWGSGKTPHDKKIKRLDFERQTGWCGAANDDKRSAAFFGWLHLRNMRLGRVS